RGLGSHWSITPVTMKLELSMDKICPTLLAPPNSRSFNRRVRITTDACSSPDDHAAPYNIGTLNMLKKSAVVARPNMDIGFMSAFGGDTDSDTWCETETREDCRARKSAIASR